MSVVTTVILVCTSMDEDTQSYCDQIAAFEWGGRTANMGQEIDACGPLVGGSKCAESDVRIAAFNHLPWEDFIGHLEHQVQWKPYDEVVVVLQSNDTDFTLVWTPSGTHTEFQRGGYQDDQRGASGA